MQTSDRPDLSEYQIRRGDWVQALMSGDLLQGNGKLHTIIDGKDMFCCLGVACEIHQSELSITGIRIDSFGDGRYVSYVTKTGPVLSTTLSTEAREFYALSGTQQNLLINLNDTGAEFAQIAQVINDLPYYIDGQYWE